MSIGNRQKRTVLTGAICALLFTAFFQNCSILNGGKPSSDTDAKGNGESYGGKVSFVNRTSILCPDGSNISSVIEVDESSRQAKLVRANCQGQTPSLLNYDGIGLKPHNPNNLIYLGRTFDQEKQVTTGLFCRLFDGLRPPLLMGGPQILFPDVVLKNYGVEENAEFPGRLILGYYGESGNFLKSVDSGEIQFKPVTSSISTMLPVTVSKIYLGESTDGSLFEVAVVQESFGVTAFVTHKAANDSSELPLLSYLTPCFTQ